MVDSMPDATSDATLVIATGHELSLAVVDGGRVLASADTAIARGHAEALVPALAALLAPLGGPDWKAARVVAEIGPGSFTGLRVGLAAAAALALAWGVELLGVRSTLLVAAEARAAGEDRELLVALAAPRGQIWLERFAAGGLDSLAPPRALFPDKAAEQAATADAVAGSALSLLGREGTGSPPRAAAAALLPLAAFQAAVPLYVRPRIDGAKPDAA